MHGNDTCINKLVCMYTIATAEGSFYVINPPCFGVDLRLRWNVQLYTKLQSHTATTFSIYKYQYKNMAEVWHEHRHQCASE